MFFLQTKYLVLGNWSRTLIFLLKKKVKKFSLL